jgi:hypothetical protein
MVLVNAMGQLNFFGGMRLRYDAVCETRHTRENCDNTGETTVRSKRTAIGIEVWGVDVVYVCASTIPKSTNI